MGRSPDIHIEDDFVNDPNQLFETLLEKVSWDERLRARKTASFGVPYNYSGMSYPTIDMLDELVPLCKEVNRKLDFYPNNCLLNYYPDGSSSMGFHSDSIEELAADTGVVIVSLGAERSIIFRSKADKSIEFSFPLKSGSLLYMSQQVQEEWLHAIPKVELSEERISITLRLIGQETPTAN
jgi:alkylated DNA repair dioxygenase AlkB